MSTPGMSDAAALAPHGLRRSVELVGLYRREPVQPAPFYEFLAWDTLDQLSPYRTSDGSGSSLVVDIGGGPGYVAEAVRRSGDQCVVVEYEEAELVLHGREASDAVIGDGQRLPFRDGVADLVHSSNVLEHVRRPEDLLGEMLRILRVGGIGYMAFTPWLSPWGGHETSPWHYLGGERAAERYERKTGHPAKNRYNRSLFKLGIPRVRSWFDSQEQLDVLWAGPRYRPPSWAPVARVPVVGEVIAWNYLVMFRRVG